MYIAYLPSCTDNLTDIDKVIVWLLRDRGFDQKHYVGLLSDSKLYILDRELT